MLEYNTWSPYWKISFVPRTLCFCGTRSFTTGKQGETGIKPHTSETPWGRGWTQGTQGFSGAGGRSDHPVSVYLRVFRWPSVHQISRSPEKMTDTWWSLVRETPSYNSIFLKTSTRCIWMTGTTTRSYYCYSLITMALWATGAHFFLNNSTFVQGTVREPISSQ